MSANYILFKNDMLLEQLFLTTIIVFIIDLSGAVEGIFKPIIRKILKLPHNSNISIKPFDCSLCMTFWTLTIYTLIVEPKLVWFFTSTMFAFFTTTIKSLLEIIKDALETFINKLYDKII